MSETKNLKRTRAQESTNAIERLYISMQHLLLEVFTNQWVFQAKH